MVTPSDQSYQQTTYSYIGTYDHLSTIPQNTKETPISNNDVKIEDPSDNNNNKPTVFPTSYLPKMTKTTNQPIAVRQSAILENMTISSLSFV